MLSFETRVKADGFSRLGRDIQAELAGIVEQSGKDLAAEAARRAPVDTGALRDSIHSEMTGPLEATVSDGVEYGIYQEFGTSRTPAQPWLGPAAQATAPEFVRKVGEAVGA